MYELKFQMQTTGMTLSLLAFNQPFIFGWLFPIGAALTTISNMIEE